ncbi:thromboxane A2 receptor-like [Ostrea edulis]|uniref:thromboxane A2 receptor-like n=1 Tax=Ostrea edulis TaxID=37623 RepID=UPI0024AED833|nr:thromboxane A2 receptor-like [Ostrea edulis]
MSNHTAAEYQICNMTTIEASWVPTALEFLFGICSNAAAMLLIWLNRREHKWSSFYKMFTALVITDFTGVLVTFPFALKRYSSNFHYCFSTYQCELVSFAMVDAHLAAALLICAMSVDRLIVLTIPRFLRNPIAGKRYTLVVILIWLISSVVAMLQLVGVGSAQLYYPGSWCYFDFIDIKNAGDFFMSYFYSITGLLLVLITLIANTFTMCKICLDPHARGTLLDSSLVSGYYDYHVMVFIIAVTVCFVVIYTPLYIDIFLHAAGIRNGNDSHEMWYERLTFLNAIIDPWLYIVLRKESIRKLVAFYKIFQRPKPPENVSLLP